MFHWMYNYRFDKVKSGGEYSDRDEEEFRFMMNKLRKQYSLSNKQALKILSIHYKSELENWDEIEDEFIGETK